MKNLLLGMILLIAANAYAQNTTSEKSMTKPWIWSIGIEPSVPLGTFNNYTSFGLGGSVQTEYKPGKAGITLKFGYIDYFGKTADGTTYSDFKYWPLLAGLKYYMSSKSFLHGQLGPGFGADGLGTSFWYGAGVGLNFSRTVDAELKYTGWNQKLVSGNNGTTYGGTGGTGGTTGGGGGYGGHYPTIDLRLGFNF